VQSLLDTPPSLPDAERLRHLVLAAEHDLALDGILVVDDQQHVLSYNQQFVEMWGIPSEVLATRDDAALLQSVVGTLLEPERFLDKVRYLYQHHDEKSRDEVQLADGRTFERYSAPILEGDAYHGRVWYFRDATARTKAAAALAASEERFRLFMDNSPAVSWIKDEEGRYVYLSKPFERRFGITLAEWTGKNDFEVWAHDMAREFYDHDRAILEDEQPRQIVERAGGPNEPDCYWLTSKFVIRDAVGHRYIAGSAVDVSALEQADNALRESEARLRLALEAAHMGIFDRDMVNDRVVWSPGNEQLFGLGANEFGGTHTAFEQRVHPADLPGLRAELARCEADRLPLTYEFRVIWPDQSEHWLSTQARFTFNDQGHPVRLQGVVLDVTTRRKSEEQLRHSMEDTVAALAAAVEARDPYTAGHQRHVAALAVAIAHELNLDQPRIQAIQLAAIVHDIGKLKLPAELLTLPRNLTSIERDLIETHVEAGYELLKGIDFPWPIADIVRQHHERLDGSGYPRGLRGDSICLEARILAVADMMDAASTDRPFRFGKGIEATLDELAAGRGVLYAADAVDACLALFRQKRFTFPP
jgi:PAS domain S-box-containing protein/putative nucleotidyltransferase with HDIG domain